MDVYADEGLTGTRMDKREDFNRMLADCRKGRIDKVLVKSISRFARNTVDTLNYTRELRSLGIPVVFEEQNINSIHPESEFLITLHGAFAQAESESTSSRVRWGKRQAMSGGRTGNLRLCRNRQKSSALFTSSIWLEVPSAPSKASWRIKAASLQLGRRNG